jgi:hypothetical protein
MTYVSLGMIKAPARANNVTDHSKTFSDLMRLMEPFKVPGTDVSAMAGYRRNNVEALVEDNEPTQGPQALTAKQTEMLTHAIQEVQEYAKQITTRPQHGRRKMVRDACHRVLADMQELADIVRKSQAQAMTQVANRVIEHLRELKRKVPPK